jgi:hypothetical protein
LSQQEELSKIKPKFTKEQMANWKGLFDGGASLKADFAD